MAEALNVSLAHIAALVNGTIEGDSGTLISGPGTLESAEAGQIVFLEKVEMLAQGEESAAAALIVAPGIEASRKPVVVTEDPRLAFSKVLELFAPKPRVEPGVHATAIVGNNVSLGEGVSIGAHAFVGDNVIVREGGIIYPLAYVGHEVTIGEGTQIYPHAFIGDRTVIGSDTIVHSGAVIGSDGFGYLQTRHGHHKIPQIGNVIVGDNVEIGACATVDRATVNATRIGNGTKIDDQVHVAHNCEIGEDCLL